MNTEWLNGTALVLPLTNVDTDQIMPARFLSRLEKTGFEDALFIDRRQDPEFVLNQAGAADAKILIAGKNFGIGSSREHAVWGLLDWGFRAVFAPAFGDIFAANAAECGLLCGVIDEDAHDLLSSIASSQPTPMRVDLMHGQLRAADQVVDFAVDNRSKRLIFRGGDAVAATLRQFEQDLTAFEATRSPFKPQVPSARS